MEICIIGLPKSGKTTIFNALTQGKSEVAAYAPSNLEPNIGIAKVEDPRMNTLKQILKPSKITLAEVKYIDIAITFRKANKDGHLTGLFLNYLSGSDAILHIVRAFSNDTIPHVEGSIDPKRDISMMDLELSLSDLGIIERRFERLEASLKGAKQMERNSILKEQSLLLKIKNGLEKEIPICEQKLSPEETKRLNNFQFLTAKPRIVIINIHENQLQQSTLLENEARSVCSYPSYDVITMCGKLEMELMQLNESEVESFRRELGLEKPAVKRVIEVSYKLQGLISFFTIVSSELKAWTISHGTTALRAAGKIHSDIERGFIKAEVISYEELRRCGNLAEAKRQGLLRLEGKDYIIQDGDIITFMFNV